MYITRHLWIYGNFLIRHLDLMNVLLEIKHWYLQKCSESILSMFGPKQLNTGMLHFVISVDINMSNN